MIFPLVLLAAASRPTTTAPIYKPHSDGCATTGRGEIPCAQTSGAQPATPATVTALWGGARESIALKSDGTVWTWGINDCILGTSLCGKLGDGTTTERHVPVQVHGPGNIGYLDSVTAIMGGEHHNFALKSDGTVWAWGGNFFGQLGNGNLINTVAPVQASFPVSVTMLGGRGYHSLAVDKNGTVWAWGYDRFTGALKADGTVWTWGANQFLQLGNATNVAYSSAPVQVFGLEHVKIYAARDYHDLAVKDDETAWAWGSGQYGELGDNLATDSSVPVQVLFGQATPYAWLWLPFIQR